VQVRKRERERDVSASSPRLTRPVGRTARHATRGIPGEAQDSEIPRNFFATLDIRRVFAEPLRKGEEGKTTTPWRTREHLIPLQYFENDF